MTIPNVRNKTSEAIATMQTKATGKGTPTGLTVHEQRALSVAIGVLREQQFIASTNTLRALLERLSAN